MLVNHRQPKQDREHREDREYRRQRLLNEPWTRPMGIADIRRIFRNKDLVRTSLATNSKGKHIERYLTEEKTFNTNRKALKSFCISKHDVSAKSARVEGNERCGCEPVH